MFTSCLFKDQNIKRCGIISPCICPELLRIQTYCRLIITCWIPISVDFVGTSEPRN